MSDIWVKMKCYKCGKEFGGEFKVGTSVFCNKCALWLPVEEDKDGDKVTRRKKV